MKRNNKYILSLLPLLTLTLTSCSKEPIYDSSDLFKVNYLKEIEALTLVEDKTTLNLDLDKANELNNTSLSVNKHTYFYDSNHNLLYHEISSYYLHEDTAAVSGTNTTYIYDAAIIRTTYYYDKTIEVRSVCNNFEGRCQNYQVTTEKVTNKDNDKITYKETISDYRISNFSGTRTVDSALTSYGFKIDTTKYNSELFNNLTSVYTYKDLVIFEAGIITSGENRELQRVELVKDPITNLYYYKSINYPELKYHGLTNYSGKATKRIEFEYNIKPIYFIPEEDLDLPKEDSTN